MDDINAPPEDGIPNGVCQLPDGVQLHIFSFLAARDLAAAGSCCIGWHDKIRNDVDTDRQWQAFYRQRWRSPANTGTGTATHWAKRFGERMDKISTFSGRFETDSLHGHKSGVRSCKILPSKHLLATGSPSSC